MYVSSHCIIKMEEQKSHLYYWNRMSLNGVHYKEPIFYINIKKLCKYDLWIFYHYRKYVFSTAVPKCSFCRGLVKWNRCNAQCIPCIRFPLIDNSSQFKKVRKRSMLSRKMILCFKISMHLLELH